MKQIGKCTFAGYKCAVLLRQYESGANALQLVRDNKWRDHVAIATVNLVDFMPEENQVLIKSWSENAGMQEALVKAGIIGPALARITCGFTAATLHGLLRTEEV